jgi:hypothetical protein
MNISEWSEIVALISTLSDEEKKELRDYLRSLLDSEDS